MICWQYTDLDTRDVATPGFPLHELDELGKAGWEAYAVTFEKEKVETDRGHRIERYRVYHLKRAIAGADKA